MVFLKSVLHNASGHLYPSPMYSSEVALYNLEEGRRLGIHISPYIGHKPLPVRKKKYLSIFRPNSKIIVFETD